MGKEDRKRRLLPAPVILVNFLCFSGRTRLAVLALAVDALNIAEQIELQSSSTEIAPVVAYAPKATHQE
jgi:hypothetical protein